MIIQETRHGILEMSDDIFHEGVIKGVMNGSFFEENFLAARDIVKERGFRVPNSMRHLIAHGNSYENIFTYADKRKEGTIVKKVDDWIDEHQANWDILAITSCNTNSVILKSRMHAGVLYPLDVATIDEFIFSGFFGRTEVGYAAPISELMLRQYLEDPRKCKYLGYNLIYYRDNHKSY